MGSLVKTIIGEPQYEVKNIANNIDMAAFTPNEQEKALTDMLLARARGEAPSAAEQQMQMGLQQAQRQAASQAAASRGVSSSLAARLASMGQAELGTQALGQSALLRTQEQQRAETGAAGLLGDQRAARGAGQELLVRGRLGEEGMRQAGAESAATRQANMLQAGAQAAAMAAMSDKNQKKNVGPGDKEVKSFLDALKAKQYEYKNPSYGEGKQVSPMAQDIEKTAIGRQMIIDTPAGKMVDYKKGMGAMLAAQAHLNERLEKVEGRKKMADGGLVIPDRYRGFAQMIQAPKMINYGEGTEGKMSNEEMKALSDLFKMKSESGQYMGAQQGTAINMTPTQPMTAFSAAPMIANQGAMVPGKAKVNGDSEENDTVPALLSPGELVVPRSVVNAGPVAVKGFAEAILQKEKRGKV